MYWAQFDGFMCDVTQKEPTKVVVGPLMLKYTMLSGFPTGLRKTKWAGQFLSSN